MNGSHSKPMNSGVATMLTQANEGDSKPDFTPAYTVLIQAYVRRRSTELRTKTEENDNGETAI
jgi:hypothetical protein